MVFTLPSMIGFLICFIMIVLDYKSWIRMCHKYIDQDYIKYTWEGSRHVYITKCMYSCCFVPGFK